MKACNIPGDPYLREFSNLILRIMSMISHNGTTQDIPSRLRAARSCPDPVAVSNLLNDSRLIVIICTLLIVHRTRSRWRPKSRTGCSLCRSVPKYDTAIEAFVLAARGLDGEPPVATSSRLPILYCTHRSGIKLVEWIALTLDARQKLRRLGISTSAVGE